MMYGVAARSEETRTDHDRDLASFCRAEFPRLVGTLGLYLGDPELGQDLAQETLVRVVQHWERVGSLDKPGAWAHRVAMNLATSARRTRLRRTRVDDRLQLPPPVVEETAVAIAVRQAVGALPDRMRQVLVLRYFADLSVKDVADVMACPEGTVKTLTSRAVEALRAAGLETEL